MFTPPKHLFIPPNLKFLEITQLVDSSKHATQHCFVYRMEYSVSEQTV